MGHEQEIQKEQAKQPAIKPELSDVGTRYTHLSDYKDALEACIEVLKRRGISSPDEKQRFVKMNMALEVLQATIDSFAGFNDYTAEYSLYRQINSIPDKAEEITGGRGTPLC